MLLRSCNWSYVSKNLTKEKAGFYASTIARESVKELHKLFPRTAATSGVASLLKVSKKARFYSGT